MNYPYADLIIPRLWIGDRNSAEDRHFLLTNKINVIVNCTKDLPNFYEPFTTEPLDHSILEKYFIKYFRVACDDNGKEQEIENFYLETMKNINQVMEQYGQNKNILVHCSAGQQRSCSFVLCMMVRMGFSKGDALEKIMQKRPQAFGMGSNYNFRLAMEKFN